MRKVFIILNFILIGFTLKAQWQRTNGPNGSFTNDFTVNGSQILAATDDDIYSTTNNGTNWSPLNTGYSLFKTLHINGSTIYAGTDNQGIIISNNNGVTWSQSNSGLSASTQVNAIASISSTVFIGTNFQSLWKSTNSGASWVSSNVGLPVGAVVSSLISNGSYLYAGTTNSFYYSSNSGASWTTPTNTGLPSTNINCLLLIGSTIYAGTSSGLYKTINNGSTWTQVSGGLPNIGISSLAVSGSTIVAGSTTTGTNIYGVYKSTNGGTSWTQAVTGLLNTQVFTLFYNSTNLFAGTPGGVYLSTNNAANWSVKNKGLSFQNYVNDIHIDGNDIYLGTNFGGIFRSNDDGLNWLELNTGLNRPSVNSICRSGANLFAATWGPGNTGGVFKSINNGSTWSPVYSNISGAKILDDGSTLYVQIGTLLNTSIDNGTSFTTLTTLPSGASIKAVNSNSIYATSSSEIYVSNDSGNSWTSLNCPANGIQCVAISGNNIFAGTSSSGVIKSTNNGATWNYINNGLNTSYSINDIAANNQYVFISGWGISYSNLNGNGWSSLNTGLTSSNTNRISLKNNLAFTSLGNKGVWKTTINNLPCVSSIYNNPQSICTGQTYSINGNTYSTSGNYMDTLLSVNSCDSIIQTDLTVNNLPNLIANTSNTLLCIGQTASLSVTGATNYTWSTAENNSTIVISPTVQTTYTVNGVDANGCTNIATITQDVSVCTGIFTSNNTALQFNVYPNPFNNKIYILSNGSKQALQIFNTFGALIYNTIIDKEKTEIDLSNQAVGIYFIKIGSITRKIIKE